MIWDAARITITSGKPATKKPRVEPMTTQAAILRDKNIARNIGTWLANVYEAGGITTFRGIIIGIMIANAINKAVMVKFRYIEEFIKASLENLLPNGYNYVYHYICICIYFYFILAYEHISPYMSI